MQDYPKHIKKLLAELATEAYERELHRELAQLDQSFAEWRNGHISSGELSHRIHQYDIGLQRGNLGWPPQFTDGAVFKAPLRQKAALF